MSTKQTSMIDKWNGKAASVLVGRKIIEARYLTDSEMDMMGWYKRPVAMFFDDGNHCIISADDEGNDGGALFYGTDGVLPTLN
jgi:hypothetical protein